MPLKQKHVVIGYPFLQKTGSFVCLNTLILKFKVFIVFAIALFWYQSMAQSVDSDGFRWGNGFYYNLNVGEVVSFNQLEIKLLKMENHFNLLKVGEDTIWLKVARRSVPEEINGIRIFVADNKKVKALTSDTLTHGLLKKDALICLSDASLNLLDPMQFLFPVSFNDGFSWNVREDCYPFSFYKTGKSLNSYSSYPGIGFSLYDSRSPKEHQLVAFENSRVVWVESLDSEGEGTRGYVLLNSETQPDIYYVYGNLDIGSMPVKKGQELKRGDAVGMAVKGDFGGYFHFAVIRSETEPTIHDSFYNILNGFPQLFELYFQRGMFVVPNFTRGKIMFGMPYDLNRNQLNSQEFETHSGKGWITGMWNPADKVEWVADDSEGNIRLRKMMFEGSAAQCKNPDNFYEYCISVRNGNYRIRAKVGDLFLPSWQKIEFEGLNVGIKILDNPGFDWTGERIVKVQDGKLNVRIYIDNENQQVAGLSEIVFQQVN